MLLLKETKKQITTTAKKTCKHQQYKNLNICEGDRIGTVPFLLAIPPLLKVKYLLFFLVKMSVVPDR